VNTRRVLDVGVLPDYAFGHHGLLWWGTVGYMVIEGTIFALLFVTYFFLRSRVPEWPPSLPNPTLTLGTINTVLMCASAIPNHFAKRAAERFELQRVRLWMIVCAAFAVAFLTVRWFELWALGAMWDSNAYGSIVWVIMGTHASHILSDLGETVVLIALMFTAHVDQKRFVDVNENARFWDFVVLSWIPTYLIIYWAPRWL
jgi:cytochrome c oxidase subunit III